MSVSTQKQIAVLVCTCRGRLAEAADLGAVLADFESRGIKAIQVEDLTTAESARAAGEAVKASGANAVVVLTCAMSSFNREIAAGAGLGPESLAVQDLRFQGVWGLDDKAAATQKLAELIAAGVRRLIAAGPVSDHQVKVERRVAVLGAGLAGLQAARVLSERGLAVNLFTLGGAESAAARAALYPGRDYSAKYEELLSGLKQTAGVEVVDQAEIVWVRGQVGRFRIRYRADGEKKTLAAGAILLDTGWEAGPVSGSERIVSAASAPDPGKGLNDGDRVCLIIDEANRETQLLSQWAVEAGMLLREKGIEVMAVARDLKVAQPEAEARYRLSREKGVQFLKYGDASPGVEEADGRAWVTLNIPDLSDQLARIPFDRVILAPELTAWAGNGELARKLNLELDEAGFFQDPFVSLFPIQTARPGILALGSAKGPETWDDAMWDAAAAVQDASALLARETIEVMGPRAEVEWERCAKCLTCVRSCPHHAIDFSNEVRAAVIDPLACRACGVCAAECPAKAIQLPAYTDAELIAEVGAPRHEYAEVRRHAYGKGHPLYDERLRT